MNIVRMLKDDYGFPQKQISEDTGIKEQRLSYIKTFSDEDFEDKTWASEYRRLKEFMDTHTKVCSKTGQRMTQGFETEFGECFAHKKDLIEWLRGLDCSDPHMDDEEYYQWCWYRGLYDYEFWYS